MEHTANTLCYNNFGQLIVIFCLYEQTIRKVVKSGKFLMTDLTSLLLSSSRLFTLFWAMFDSYVYWCTLCM